MKNLATILLVFVIALSSQAAPIPMNYTDTFGPKYQEDFSNHQNTGKNSFRMVVYNIEFSKKLNEILNHFKTHPKLMDADIIALQEVMGDPADPENNSAKVMAEALNLNYVYYPAIIHQKTGRDFGNAILSKYPIYNSKKIILPHPHFLKKTQRISVGATVDLEGVPVRVYSSHLETQQTNSMRNSQALMALVDSFNSGLDRVIIGGDFNTIRRSSKKLIRQTHDLFGFKDETAILGCTHLLWFLCLVQLDHVFSKNLEFLDSSKVKIKTSDHLPVVLNFKL